MANGKTTLGIISHQRIAKSMAGPGIRCWETALALAEDADVILFTPEESDLSHGSLRIVSYTEDTLVDRASACDAILCQGFIFNNFPGLKELGKHLIVDLYVPMTLEALAQYEHKSMDEQAAVQQNIIAAILEQLTIGHFFICASERQRDYWLGLLTAVGRIDPKSYGDDCSLHRLIDVVPFGLPDEPPYSDKKSLKGVYPGIGEKDKVLLWGGGIYNWLDPFTPIKAVAELAQRRNDIKLFFMGARHPDPNVPAMKAYDEAVALSRKLDVLDSSVFFNNKWVPYSERVGFLLDADLGVNANIDHIETRFSFRTRILDCIWSALPVVSTHGDFLSSLVEQRRLGLVTDPGDTHAYAQAIETLIDDPVRHEEYRKNLRAVAAEFTWSEATRPLRGFLERIASGKPGAADGSRLQISLPTVDGKVQDERGPGIFFRKAVNRLKSRIR